jgi:glycosyltransferase involved in cell wall biosynthesis
MPRDIPYLVHIPEYCVYIHPSEWAANAWRELGYARTVIDTWPVGIDSSTFEIYKQKQKNKTEVLFYYKCRDKNKIDGATLIEEVLRCEGIKFKRFNYGSYDQKDYLNTLGESKYVVWYGRQESQGLALQEALSMGCPIIVVDVKTIGENDGTGYQFTEKEALISATSAPYFDDRCGLKISDLNQLAYVVKFMERSFEKFKPNDYVAENLTIEVSSRNFVSLFEKWWPEKRIVINENLLGKQFKPPWNWKFAAIEMRLRKLSYMQILLKIFSQNRR